MAALSGCRNRAYNDVYIENMAAEIRDLENQLYEYDHEYRLLEQQLNTLQHQNAALKNSVSTQTQSGSKRSLLSPLGPLAQPPDQSSRTAPRNPVLPIQPDPMLEPPQPKTLPPTQIQPQPNSILEPDQPGTSRPPQIEEMPPPQAGRIPLPSDSRGAGAPERLPSEPPSFNPQPKAPGPKSAIPKFPVPQGGNEFDSEELLLPPTIDPGIPTPPPLPGVSQLGNGTPVAPENNLEMNLSRIEIPKQKTPAQLASNTSVNQASIKIATEKVTDTRVVELAFHPSLSRAINMDDRPDDDGLYLVLQPKNERGQMVPVAADLTIFVLDPAREGDAAKIGRWEYKAADVQSKLQPIGSEQGIHFRLPWNGPDPAADRIIVFALYKFDNGRQVMGEKEIFISSDGSHKTVWTARDGASSSVPQVASASYVTPSGERPVNNDVAASPASPTLVIRPASGTSTFDPAPQPR